MQVSVPGIYQKPAPYSEQTLTYSTALAFSGRSAALAPPTASRPAAEPRKRPFIEFILNLQVAIGSKTAVFAGVPPNRRRPPIEPPDGTSRRAGVVKTLA